jgi:flagellin-like protein
MKNFNRKGVSEIIATVIIIALVLLITGIVWTAVNGLIQSRIGNAEACFGNFNKITLDKQFTCYDSNLKETRFMIVVGDVNVDEVLVSVSSNSSSQSFKLSNTEQTISGLTYLNGTAAVRLPEKNGGTTFVYTFDGARTIKIAPIISGNQCEVSDSIPALDDCSLLG